MSLKERSHYSLSVDCVVFGYSQGALQAVLIKRKKEPYKGMWALPGGFIIDDETIEEAAFRELKEETGITDIYLEQYHVFSKPDRDPRGRVITVALYALVDPKQFHLVASEDAEQAKWWPAYNLPKLAFDHKKIYEEALHALRRSFEQKPLAFELLGDAFTLTELQQLYEQVFDCELDKRNFRKKILKEDFLHASGKMQKGGPHRPAMLYTYKANKKTKGRA